MRNEQEFALSYLEGISHKDIENLVSDYVNEYTKGN